MQGLTDSTGNTHIVFTSHISFTSHTSRTSHPTCAAMRLSHRHHPLPTHPPPSHPTPHLCSNATIKPPSVYAIAQKLPILQQLGDVITNMMNLPSNFNFLECNHHGTYGSFSRTSLGKQVTKLWVGGGEWGWVSGGG